MKFRAMAVFDDEQTKWWMAGYNGGPAIEADSLGDAINSVIAKMRFDSDATKDFKGMLLDYIKVTSDDGCQSAKVQILATTFSV